MKKLILFFVFTITSVVSFAYDFGVNGIYYNKLSDNTCEVTYKNTYYNSYSGAIVLSEEIVYQGVTYLVTAIGDRAFYNCSDLTSITVPNSVTNIGKGAFMNSYNIKSVYISSIESWCNIKFEDLYSQPLLDNGQLILNNEPVSALVVPNSVTKIGKYAFYGCSTLTSVIISSSITSIEESAFESCYNLVSVMIPNSVTYIGNRVFCMCYKLASVTIPNSVTSIGDNAFSYCNIASVTIPNSVTNIGEGVFSGCSGLTSVTIPNSVTSIGDNAFTDCYRLTSVTIPSSVISIGDKAFSGSFGLTSITIPNSVIGIGNYAFQGCDGLTSVSIGNSVVSIGEGAFYNCSNFTSVTIPSSVDRIGKGAFFCCYRLIDVTVLREKPLEIPSDIFTGTPDKKTLHVYKGYKYAYATADVWKEFSEILDDIPLPEKPDPEKCATPTISLVDGEVIATCETEGAVCHITTRMNANTPSGDDSVMPTAVLTVTAYATADGYNQSETATKEFDLMKLQGEGGVKGDTNGDGQVTVTDIVKTAGYILTGEWGE